MAHKGLHLSLNEAPRQFQALYLAKPPPFPHHQQGQAQWPRHAGSNQQHPASLRSDVDQAPIIRNSIADSEVVGEAFDSFIWKLNKFYADKYALGGSQAATYVGRGLFPRLGLKNVMHPPPPEWAGEGAELR
eukprot:6948171-Alexandrium_andersonii.AAC.1